jgi:urea carboxylase
VLKIGAVRTGGLPQLPGGGGGLDVPDYLGSKSTFTLGQFGGHGGRNLRVGDVCTWRSARHSPAGVRPA